MNVCLDIVADMECTGHVVRMDQGKSFQGIYEI